MFKRKNKDRDVSDETKVVEIASEQILEEVSEKRKIEDETSIEQELKIKSYIDQKFDQMTRELSESNTSQMDRVNDTIGRLTNGLNQLLSAMQSELEAVKNIALEKEVKIQRYEEGYDQKNIKNFLGDLLRITDFANSKKDTSKEMSEIYEDLELLLEDAGMEKINFSAGESYDGNAKIVKIIDTLPTEDKEQDQTVADIKKSGYFIRISEDQTRVIRPVEAILYRYKNS